jgi:hypothetical protein
MVSPPAGAYIPLFTIYQVLPDRLPEDSPISCANCGQAGHNKNLLAGLSNFQKTCTRILSAWTSTRLCGPALNCVLDEVPEYRPKSFKQKHVVSRTPRSQCIKNKYQLYTVLYYCTAVILENSSPTSTHY